MKNILLLSLKNLRRDALHSTAIVITFILISLLVIILGNIMFYMNENADDVVVKDVNEAGTSVRLFIKPQYESAPLMIMQSDVLSDVIAIFEKKDEKFSYSLKCLNLDAFFNANSISVRPYVAYGMLDEFTVIRGALLDKNHDNKNYIWLSSRLADDIDVGKNITINLNNNMLDFNVAGIVDSPNSYIDYRYFSVNILEGFSDTKYQKVSPIKSLKREIDAKTRSLKKIDEGYCIIVSSVSTYEYLSGINMFVTGICLALIALTILLALIGLSNAVKLKVNETKSSLGIMRALGMRDSGIMLYHLTMWLIYAIIAIFIAVIISSIILHFALADILLKFFMLLNWMPPRIIAGYNFLIPLLCFVILVTICALVAIIEGKKIAKHDISPLLRGDV